MDIDERSGSDRDDRDDRDLSTEDAGGEAKPATEQEEGLGQEGTDTDQDYAGGTPR
ncbi:hypothetical protein [Actinophytocola xanthii]|uniref:hypothetical protein n=1 Tax=Actinophytocola xanthii TaxID=1912961 RepID=UPI001301474F|nr:hypothetical protein [Actinophytocola xanthii]